MVGVVWGNTCSRRLFAKIACLGVVYAGFSMYVGEGRRVEGGGRQAAPSSIEKTAKV